MNEKRYKLMAGMSIDVTRVWTVSKKIESDKR